MRVITAPNYYEKSPNDICVFLAGGITKCENWQNAVIKILYKFEAEGEKLDNLVIFNPRRSNFNIKDSSETIRQIEWEYRYLTDCDIFSIYFCDSESDQPICMYELGSYSRMMFDKYKRNVKNHLIINCEDGYRRTFDVHYQTQLLLKRGIAKKKQNPIKHAIDICDKYYAVLSEKEVSE